MSRKASLLSELTQSNTKSLSERCLEAVRKAAINDQIRQRVIAPFLENFRRTKGMLLEDHPVPITWAMVQQGALLCDLLNWTMKGIVGDVQYPEADDMFGVCEKNVRAFFESAVSQYFIAEDPLFSVEDLCKDENYLTTLDAVLDVMLARIYQAEFNERLSMDEEVERMRQKDPDSLLFAHEQVAVQESPVEEGSPRRLHALRELRTSEAQYVADMKALRRYVQEVCSRNLVPRVQIEGMLLDLEAIVEFQERFLLCLERSIPERRLHSYATSLECRPDQCIVQFEGQLVAAYEPFIMHYALSAMAIKQNMAALSVPGLIPPSVICTSYLMKPFQRLCKYQLLYEAIKKHTLPEHHGDLPLACKVCHRIAISVNDIKRAAENAAEDARFRSETEFGDAKGLGKLLLFAPGQIRESGKPVHGKCEMFLYEGYLLAVSQGSIEAAIKCGRMRRATDTSHVEPSSLKLNFEDEHGTAHMVLIVLETAEQQRIWLDTLRKSIASGRESTANSISRLSLNASAYGAPDIADVLRSVNRLSIRPRSALEPPDEWASDDFMRTFIVEAAQPTCLMIRFREQYPSIESVKAELEFRLKAPVSVLCVRFQGCAVQVTADGQFHYVLRRLEETHPKECAHLVIGQ